MSTISFVDQPLVVTIENAVAGDGGQILLFGIDDANGLILASGVFEWYPIAAIRVVMSAIPYERVDEPETPEP